MQFATIAYLPPRGRFNSDSFFRNLEAWPPKHPLLLYTDDPSWGPSWAVHIVQNPESYRNRYPYSVNNAVFLMGLLLAIQQGIEFFLYLESDCRVRGDNWDDTIWQDFQTWKNPVAWGSPIIYNQSQNGHDNLKAATELAWTYQKETGLAVPQYGAWPGAGKDLCLYPNGAIGIYHTQTIAKIFPNATTRFHEEVASMIAWDVSIGAGLWRIFHEDIFNRFAFSRVTYSGCGDSLVTAGGRRYMLESGSKVAVHQWKGTETFEV